MRILKSLEESGSLINGETIENEAGEQKGGFIGMLLGILGAKLFRTLLVGHGVHAGERVNQSWWRNS